MRPALPTGTVTFLFTDIEGSTRLLHTLGSSDHAAAVAEHRRVLRAAFAAITKGTRWIRRAMLALESLELSTARRSPPTWRGTGGEAGYSRTWPFSRSVAATWPRPSPSVSRCCSSIGKRRIAQRRFTHSRHSRESCRSAKTGGAPGSCGSARGGARAGVSNQAWEYVRVERSGSLLDETNPTFLAGVEEGLRLELWDAVAMALGELELPQIEP